MLENDSLDVLGNQPSLHKLYTQISSVYSVSNADVHDRIVGTLRNGLDRLAKSFPWLAGYVVNEGSSDGVTGTFRIIPTDQIPLVVKDLRGDTTLPTLDSLRQANYPFNMLDEKLIAPCMTINIPGMPIGLVADHGPVFAVQVTFITGGLVLTIVGQHNTMDMMGQNSVINWLSKACHEEPISSEDLAIGNMDKSKSIELLDDSWQPGVDIEHQMVKTPAGGYGDSAPGHPPKLTWGYSTFSKASLAALKSLATETKLSTTSFVSSDDTVCAFVWKCLSRARALRLEPGTKSTFARAIDVRSRLGLPGSYPGAVTNMTYNESSLHTVDQQPLGETASQLRNQLDPKVTDLAYNTRALATFLSRCEEKNKILITGSVDPSSGIMLSSWAGINLYDLDFNLGLGKPEAVRRPGFMPVESLMYIMPKSPQGEVAIGMCLRDEDWQRLNADTEWNKYATYIG